MLRSSWGGRIQHTKLIRGPLWFKPTNIVDQLITFDLLRRQFKKSLLKNYNFLPEMPPINESLNFFRNKNCIKSGPPFSTSHIELTVSVETLRSNLKGQFRNQLRKAEKDNLSIQDTPNVDYITSGFENLKRRKYFRGPTKQFLESYLGKTPYIHLHAHKESSANLADVLFVIHGTTATYLIGLISQEGRTYHAKNLLLWEALLRLKSLGVNTVDLGGTHMTRSEKITHFKQGLGGTAFETLPTYV